MKDLEKPYLLNSYKLKERKMQVLQSIPAANPLNAANAANSPVAQYIVYPVTYGGMRRAKEFLESDANKLTHHPIRYKFERAKDLEKLFKEINNEATKKELDSNFNTNFKEALKKYFGIPSATKFSIARVTVYEKEVQHQPPQGPGQEVEGNQPQDQNLAPNEPKKKYKVVNTEIYVPCKKNFKYDNSYRTPGQKHEQNNAALHPNDDLEELKPSDVLFKVQINHWHPDLKDRKAFTYENQAPKSRSLCELAHANSKFIRVDLNSYKAKLTFQIGTGFNPKNKIKLTHKDNEFAHINCYRDTKDKIAKITGEISEHRFHNQANQRWYVYWENISPANSIYEELKTITSFIHKYQAKNNDAAVSQAAAMLDAMFGLLQYPTVNWQDMIRITTGKVFAHDIDNYVKSFSGGLIKINKANLLAHYEESDLKNSHATTKFHVLKQQFISLISKTQAQDVINNIEDASKLFDKSKRSPDLIQGASVDKTSSPKETMNFFLDQILKGKKIAQNIDQMDEVDGNDKVQLISIWGKLLKSVYNPFAKFADCMEAIKNGNIEGYRDRDGTSTALIKRALDWLTENNPDHIHVFNKLVSELFRDYMRVEIYLESTQYMLRHRAEQLAQANNEAQAQLQHNQHVPDMDEDEPDMAAPTNHMDYEAPYERNHEDNIDFAGADGM